MEPTTTKLGVLARSVDSLFDAMVIGQQDSMSTVMMPILRQGLAVLGKRADMMDEPGRRRMEHVFGAMLVKLGTGLGDDNVSVDEYAAGFAE